MTHGGPAAVRALRGLQISSSRCWAAGRLQPQFTLAYAIDLRPQHPGKWGSIRHESHAAKALSETGTATQSDSNPEITEHSALVESLNPPVSTLPATLQFPERKPDQSALKYWWKFGKAFWAFYKQGVKNINANRKAAKEIRARTEKDSNAAAASSGSKASVQDNDATSSTLKALTRSEWHLERRSRAEMRRVPIFAVILAAFGEWTPLLVMFATPIVPYNCRIPRQIRRSREKQEARRSRSFRGAFRCLDGPGRNKPYVPSPAHGSGVLSRDNDSRRAPIDALGHVCRNLNVYPSWQDTGRAITWVAIMLRSMTKSSLHRHLIGYLRRDDEFLLSDRGEVAPETTPSLLRDEEVLVAAEERGIDVLHRPIGDVRHDLGLWLSVVQAETRHDKSDSHYRDTVVKLSLMRPNQWADITSAAHSRTG